MNVKEGDVAMIIKGRDKNLGKLALVTTFYGDADYSRMGYGMLPCWNVESLEDSNFDTEAGPTSRGYTPDMTLVPLPDISPEQAEAMRKVKAERTIAAGLRELAAVFAANDACERAKKNTRGIVPKPTAVPVSEKYGHGSLRAVMEQRLGGMDEACERDSLTNP